MKQAVLFVFNGDPMCFIHVLLNALDLNARNQGGRIVVEGAATQLVTELTREEHPLHALWEKVKAADLVEGVCKACSQKMGVLDQINELGLPLGEDMMGHPGMARYVKEGFSIITF